MHLLYVDESGATNDPNQKFFVLAGVAVHERQTHWIEQKMNTIAGRFTESNEPECIYGLELHGSPMRSGQKKWRGHAPEKRSQAIKDCLQIIADSHGKVRLFACVVEKGANISQEVIPHCFEQISSRFDKYLARMHQNGDTQRGIAIFDKSSTEKSIQQLAWQFKNNGHQFGALRNFSEVPVFLDSKVSRLIQLADLVAYAIFRHHENADSSYYNVIARCFDHNNGVVHGLREYLCTDTPYTD